MDHNNLEFDKNVTVCFDSLPVSSYGFWLGAQPLRATLPLLMLQISMIVVSCRVVHSLLRRLGQVEATCQITAGILLGPSFAGAIPWFRLTFFPESSWMNLTIIAHVGYVLFMFLIGVKTDLSYILKSGRKGMAFGLVGIFAPLAIVFLFGYPIRASIPVDMASVIKGVAVRWCMTSFAVVSHTLAEFRLLNSSVGRIAMSASLLSNFVFIMGIVLLSSVESGDRTSNKVSALFMTTSFIALALTTVFAIRILTMWLIKKTPPQQPLKERHFTAVLVMAFGCGMLYELLGYHVAAGMFLMGLALPSGAPLGTTLVRRLEGLVSELFLPVFLAMGGLKTHLSVLTSHADQLKYMQLFFVLIIVGKSAGVILTGLYSKMRLRDTFALALVMNVRGIGEVNALNLWQNGGIARHHTYGMGIIFIVASAGIATPLLKLIYQPDVSYGKTKGRSVQQSKHDAELCILACIHGEEDVAPILDVVQAVRPAPGGFRGRPICVYILHLIQLAGRSAASFGPYHDSRESPEEDSAVTDHIVCAFRKFELASRASFYPFVSSSPYVSMHLDICSLAQEKKVAMIILPFHKRMAVHGAVEVTGSHRVVNTSVIRYSPCSIGILVSQLRHRGHSMKAAVPSRCGTRLYVAVYFIGGPDDREALSFAERMLGNPNVFLTLIRFRPPERCPVIDAREHRLDDELVNEFLLDNAQNERVACCEEVVQNGLELMGVIEEIGDEFNLVIVGRRLGMESPMTAGIGIWSENTELGVLGDLLTSTDICCKAVTLVVQHQSGERAQWQPAEPSQTMGTSHEEPLEGNGSL